MPTVKIAPSMLSADHGNMAAECIRVESWGADWLHIDVMDGIFAPNLTFGPGLVKAIRSKISIPLDCHLMLSKPEKYVGPFLEAGADYVTVHAEAVNPSSLHEIKKIVKESKRGKLGIALKPATDLSKLNLSDTELSVLLVMSVNPGFSGQKFMPEIVPKLRKASNLLEESNRHVEIEVDGGVDSSNAKMLVENGATVLVAGNSIFGQRDQRAALREMKEIIGSSS